MNLKNKIWCSELAARPNATTIFNRSSTGIAGSNTARAWMYDRPFLCYIVLCRYRPKGFTFSDVIFIRSSSEDLVRERLRRNIKHYWKVRDYYGIDACIWFRTIKWNMMICFKKYPDYWEEDIYFFIRNHELLATQLVFAKLWRFSFICNTILKRLTSFLNFDHSKSNKDAQFWLKLCPAGRSQSLSDRIGEARV
jgi:hypothetical protein